MASSSGRGGRGRRGGTRAVAEALERRTLMAVSLVADISQRPGSPITAQGIYVSDSTAYFGYSDAVHGIELWKTDGTAAGTSQVKDIWPGAGDSAPSGFARMGAHVYFWAVDPAHGAELWRTDGTDAGTTLVADVNPGTASSYPDHLTAAGGKLYFVADDGVHGPELWVSDGTPGGTSLVKDLTAGNTKSLISSIAPLPGGGVVFGGTSSTNTTVWRTDGTEAGTSPLRTGSGAPVGMRSGVASGGRAFFIDNSSHLWTTDGTAAGSVAIGSSSEYVDTILDVSGNLYCIVNGDDLWRLPAGSNTPTKIAQTFNDPSDLVAVGTSLFFGAYENSSGDHVLMKLVPGQTTAVTVTAYLPTSPFGLTGVGGKLYYLTGYSSIGYTLHTNTGTVASDLAVTTFPKGIAPYLFTPFGSQLMFVHQDQAAGAEFWISDGTAGGTKMIKDIYAGTNGSDPIPVGSVGGRVLLNADDDVHGAELWITDGTPGGTSLLKDIEPGAVGANPLGPVRSLGAKTFFTARTSAAGDELWVTDGTPEGTLLLKDINPGTADARPRSLVVLDGVLYFTADDGVHGDELWRSDGTPAGTRLVTDLSPGSGDGIVSELAVVNGALFFMATDGARGGLWTSDGSAQGTAVVRDLAADKVSSYTSWLRAGNGRLYFKATTAGAGAELWVSDGTRDGTRMLGDLAAGSLGSNPGAPVFSGDLAYFTAADTAHGQELWRTDGTPAGTSRVADLAPGAAGSSPSGLTDVNGTLFFFTSGTGEYKDLWTTRGTPETTRFLRSGLYTLTSTASLGGKFLFVADAATVAGVPETGNELWVSDGTPAGTHLLQDVQTGVFGSHPRSFYPSGDSLYFVAWDETYGYELWRYTPAPPVAVIAGGPYSLVEGFTITLQGENSTDAVTWEWDFDYDGVTFNPTATTRMPLFSAAGIDGPATRTIALRVSDGSGNVSTIATTRLTVTNLAPTAALTNSGPVQEANPATVTFSNASDVPSDVAAGFHYSFDFDNDGSFEVVDSTSPSATVPGGYLAGRSSRIVRGRITDKDGGFTDYTTTITITFPASASISYPSSVNEGSTATFAFGTPSGPGPYAYWFDYNNDGTWEVSNSATSSKTIPASYFADGPGTRTVRARISGPGGFTEYVVDLPINNVAPTVFSLGAMPAGAKEGTAVTLTPTASDASPTDLAAGLTLNWTILRNGSAYTTGTGASFTFTPGDNGTYSVSVTATDKDGATSPAATSSFTAANVAPTATVAAPASVQSGATTAAVTFSTPVDAPADTAAGFLYSFDFDNNGVFEIADASSPVATIPAGYLTGVSSRTVRARIKDKDGGFTDYTRTIQVTLPPPTATFSAGPVNEGASRAVAFTGAAGGLAPYRYSYDYDNNGTFEVTNSTSASVTVPASYFADGPFTRTVRGRVSSADGQFTDYTADIAVNNAPPTATFAVVGAAVLNLPAVLAFSAPADPSPADVAAGFKYSFDFDNDGTFEIADSSSASATLPASYLTTLGTRTVRGRIADKDGGFTDYPLTLNVVTLSIVAKPTSTYYAQENSFTTLFDNGSSSNAAPIVSYEWDTQYDGTTFHPTLTGPAPRLSAVGLDGPSSRTIALRVTDALGNAATATAKLQITNVAPVVSATPVGPAAAGRPLTVNLASSDPGGDTITRWVINWGDGTPNTTLTGNPSSVAHTFPAAGDYIVSATVTDEDGTYTQQLLGPGSVDPTFGANGRLRRPYDGAAYINGFPATRQIVQPDGKLLSLDTFSPNLPALPGVLRLSRYNGDGTPDTSFGDGGSFLVTTDPKSGMSSAGFALQPDGRILVSSYYPTPFLARYTPAGAPDASFGTNGRVALAYSAPSLFVQPDGKILSTSGNEVRRFNSDGSVDAAFGNAGHFTLGFPDLYTNFASLALTPGGEIVVGGNVSGQDLSADTRPIVARLTPGGTLDPSFGQGGYTITPVPAGSDSYGEGFLRQPDGKLLLFVSHYPGGLGTGSYLRVLRYTAAGTLDPTFGIDGIADVTGAGLTHAFALHPDGSILVTNARGAELILVRLTSTGAPDASFGAGGYARMPRSERFDVTDTVSPAPDGGILLTGIEASTSPVTFKLRSTPFSVSPPTASATFSAPASVAEGAPGAVLSFTKEAGGGPYSYSYDFDNDGTFEIADSASASAVLPASLFADGPFTRTVRGRITGATGYSDYTASIAVTNVRPTVTLGAVPAGKTELQPVTLTASAADQSAGFTFAWTVRRGTDTVATGTGASFTFTPPDSGTYAVSVAATDKDGGTSAAPATGTLAVANVAPTATFTVPAGVAAGAPASVSLDNPADAPGDLPSLRYSFDFDNDGTFEVTNSALASATVPASFLAAAGAHAIRARVSDKDGAFTDYAATLIAAVVPPAATLAAPASVAEGAASAVVSFSNPGGSGPFRYSFDFDDDGLFEVVDSASASAPIPAGHLADGPLARTVRGRITGPGGSADYTAAVAVTNERPTVTLAPPPDLADGVPVTITASAADPSPADAAAGFAFAWSLSRDGSVVATGAGPSFTFTPTPGTAYAVAVTATDKDGAASSPATASLALPAIAPPADTTAPAAALAGPAAVPTAGSGTYTFSVTYTDDSGIDAATLDGADVRVTGPGNFAAFASLVSVAGTATSLTATYSLTPPGGSWDYADNGTYTLALQPDAVADPSGNRAPAGALGSFELALEQPDTPILAAQFGTGRPASPNFTVTAVAFKKLPVVNGTVLGGSPLSGTVTLRNAGGGATTGAASVTFYLSPDTVASTRDTVLRTIVVRLGTLKPAKTKAAPFSVTLPPGVSGARHVVAVVTPAALESDTLDNARASGALNLSPATVNLAAVSLAAKPGKSPSASLVVRNAGNTPFNRTVPVALRFTDAATGITTELGTLAAPVSLKPAQLKTLNLKIPLPASLAGHHGTLTALLDPTNALGQSSAADDQASVAI